ncbi:MAG: DUF1295 domain-containing protein [Deltaproteobacteria bacterium]|nr:DUF1295 domain-containing protein [Deltaproteobacteria bacterium]
MTFGALILANSAALFGLFLVLYFVSLVRRDASIVDIAWGPAFVLVAWIGLLAGGAPGPRPAIVTALVTLWGVRLGLHLFLRSRGRGEDLRYRAMREAHGARFAWVSLFTVFLLQAALVLVISTPVTLIASRSADTATLEASAMGASLSWLDAMAAILMISGLLIESIADLQLTRFLRDPRSRGRVLDRGLWRYSRHPNYFGDAVVWWGLGLFGLASGGWISLLGPSIMTFLLLRVSGVVLLEKTITARRPAYAEYVARTSAFFPRPRRGRTSASNAARIY